VSQNQQLDTNERQKIAVAAVTAEDVRFFLFLPNFSYFLALSIASSLVSLANFP
jgi:hypothetical protein